MAGRRVRNPRNAPPCNCEFRRRSCRPASDCAPGFSDRWRDRHANRPGTGFGKPGTADRTSTSSRGFPARDHRLRWVLRGPDQFHTASATATRQRFSSAELLRHRQDFVLEYFWGDRTDALIANHAIAVDEIGFRHAIYAVVNANTPVAVFYGHGIRVAVFT